MVVYYITQIQFIVYHTYYFVGCHTGIKYFHYNPNNLKITFKAIACVLIKSIYQNQFIIKINYLNFLHHYIQGLLI